MPTLSLPSRFSGRPDLWLLAAALALAGLRADEARTVPATAVPLDLGERLELFVDRFLIERLDGARLKLHEPRLAGVALRFDSPWDGACTGYITVLRDGDLMRMYYVGLPMKDSDEEAGSYPCYAESRDGVTWTKPDLGLVDFQGSKKNNILLPPSKEEPYTINFCPFIDRRPGVPREERFKAVGGTARKGLFALVSGDGIHWKKWRTEPIFRGGAFDSQNLAFWSETENCYVLYFRVFTGTSGGLSTFSGYRTVAKSTSPDLINWSKPQRMSFGDTPIEHLYTTGTDPYFRAPHLYVAMPMRFVPNRQALTAEQFAALQVAPVYASIKGPNNEHNIPREVSDSVLMTSRGGYRYDRTFMEAFIRPGLELGDWVSRNGMNAKGIVPTGPAEMSLYHQAHYAQASASLRRYTLRTDGFSSVNAPYGGGEMLTRPLKISGGHLVLNCATSAPGGIRVELQEPDGEPIPGFTLMESAEFVGDSIEHVAGWKLGSDLTALAGRPVRIRFVMKDADLYSLRFR